MSSSEIITSMTAMLSPLVRELGCELWGIEYQPQGKHSLLRVYIDKPEGVTLEDCERVGSQLSATLDVAEPIKGHYQLEVSSPGIERPLFTREQYGNYVGKELVIRLHTPIKERRKFRGVLMEVTEDKVVLQVDNATIDLPFNAIDKAHLCWNE